MSKYSFNCIVLRQAIKELDKKEKREEDKITNGGTLFQSLMRMKAKTNTGKIHKEEKGRKDAGGETMTGANSIKK